jgi:DNA-binding MarR family transcriptional regulator
MAETPAQRTAVDAQVSPRRAWPVDSLSYLVWRAHLVFRRVLDDALAELGVTVAQVGLAAELIEHGPRAVADLARVIGITPQGTALATSHLRKLGWVAPSQAPRRGRAVLLEITGAGREGHRKAARIIEQVDESMTGGITPAERDCARAALRGIVGATP